MSSAELWIVGSPLHEGETFSPEVRKRLAACDIVIGESRKAAGRYLRDTPLKSPLFALDPPRKDTFDDLKQELKKLSGTGGRAALFSDTGMPLLFDPGIEVLEYCRTLGFAIRTLPGATSWGSACALSGWSPPFLLYGFLPQKAEARKSELQRLAGEMSHVVFLETPYRFSTLLEELGAAFGPRRPLFLAWEIGRPEEFYFWGTLAELDRIRKQRGMQKGEFVLIAHSKSFT